VISEEEYEECLDEARRLMKTTAFGVLPLFDAIRDVFKKRGIRLWPRLTFAIIDRIWIDLLKDRLPDRV